METTLTIEGLDTDTFERLKLEAKRRGVEVPALAKTLLEESIENSSSHHDLDFLMGTWSEEDAAIFDASLAPTRIIDAELWR